MPTHIPAQWKHCSHRTAGGELDDARSRCDKQRDAERGEDINKDAGAGTREDDTDARSDSGSGLVQIVPAEHCMGHRASMSPRNGRDCRLGRERKTIVKSHGTPLHFRALIVYAYTSAASAVTSARLTYRIVFVSSVRATTDPVFVIGHMEG